nr:MAG TPA: Permuted papain-like amidase enzyme, YaeF/YiiX, C92 family [Caudoviricetes sp.]
MNMYDLFYKDKKVSASEKLNEIINTIPNDNESKAYSESFGGTGLFDFLDNKSLSSDEVKKKLDEIKDEIKSSKSEEDKKKLLDLYSHIAAEKESDKFVLGKDLKYKFKKDVPYIVLHSADDLFSQAIRWWTKSPFSHVDLVINGKAYTAYTKGGIDEYPITPTSRVLVYELSKVFNVKKIMEFFKRTRYAKYGFSRVFDSFILNHPKKEKEDFKQFFCSHWVMAALDYASDYKFKIEDKGLKFIGYDTFSPFGVFEWMINTPKALAKKVTFSESLLPFMEAEVEDIPSGDLQESGSDDGLEMEDTGGSDDGLGDDGGFGSDDGFSDDGFGDENGEGSEGQLPDPLADVDDSEKTLVKDLRSNMATFYKERERELEELLSSNISSLDYSKELTELTERYKTTLGLLEEYLRSQFYNESTSTKVNTFIQYKGTFNSINKAINNIYEKLGVEREEY